jgi:hypothetical protein
MQTGGAAAQQLVAHAGNEIQAERLDRCRVIHIAFASCWSSQRGISAPQAAEKRDNWLKFEIGMMPGTIGSVTPRAAAIVDEIEIGVGVEEILRDRRIGAGIRLALEIQFRSSR